jgi:hypothetical protein
MFAMIGAEAGYILGPVAELREPIESRQAPHLMGTGDAGQGTASWSPQLPCSTLCAPARMLAGSTSRARRGSGVTIGWSRERGPWTLQMDVGTAEYWQRRGDHTTTS